MHPEPSLQAVDLAAKLTAERGRLALPVARTILAFAVQGEEVSAIELWLDTCAILAGSHPPFERKPQAWRRQRA